MLQPTRTKFRKAHKGRIHGHASRCNLMNYGAYGLKAMEPERVIGKQIEVLVDEPGIGRTFREAPEIDGVVLVPEKLQVGDFATVSVTGALGPDLETI